MSTDTAAIVATDTATIDPTIPGTITLIPHHEQVVVVGTELATALGYQRRDAISSLIGREWSGVMRESEHYLLVRGQDLTRLRHSATRVLAEQAATGTTARDNPVPAKCRALFVLTETGLDLACSMSRQSAAVALRARIAAMLPGVRRTPPSVAVEAAMAAETHAVTRATPVATTAADPRIDRLVSAVESLVGVVTVLLQRQALQPAPSPVAALPVAQVAPAAPANDGAEIPSGWLSASAIAARVSARLQRPISPQLVGRTINDLGIRTRGHHVARCRIETRESGGREIEIPRWYFAPGVVDEIVSGIPSDSTTARCAADTLRAVAAQMDLDLTPPRMPRPGHRSARGGSR